MNFAHSTLQVKAAFPEWPRDKAKSVLSAEKAVELVAAAVSKAT